MCAFGADLVLVPGDTRDARPPEAPHLHGSRGPQTRDANAPSSPRTAPLTLKALQDGAIQLAVLYTADPAISSSDLVPLDDTAGLFLTSHVVPIASDKVDQRARDIIDAVSAALTPDGLIALMKLSQAVAQEIDNGTTVQSQNSRDQTVAFVTRPLYSEYTVNVCCGIHRM